MCLVSFLDGTWAVVDPEGRYDASNSGDIEGLHWVVGNETIALSQLKHRYYEPELLANIIKREPLRNVSAFKDVKLFPEAAYQAPVAGSTKLAIKLTNRGGGIGKVRVLVNGKEVTADARGERPNPQAAKGELTVDLAGAAIKPGEANSIRVLAYNAENWLSSRGPQIAWVPEGKVEVSKPELYAIVGGISNYATEAITLRYAAKDAEDMANALRLGAKRLFGAEKVHMTVLSTSHNVGTIAPTKENFTKAFTAARQAKPGDILVVYLSGHGIALRLSGDNDTYCYLTREARGTDLTDEALRREQSITSDEMTEWIKQIPALKQVMMLDTCAAGAAQTDLTKMRNLSPDQIRALDRLKDRTGFHILMGAAADKVSYETSQYNQGLLTYALLEGMKGAALREDDFIDVSKLFQYAADRVPQLARGIGLGGVQKPEVSAPRGTSFEIGQMQAGDKLAILLANAKPLILRPRFLNEIEKFDDLELEAEMRKVLRDENESLAKGEHGGVAFVDADELPGALRPAGTYRIDGESVRVAVNLIRNKTKVASFEVAGRKSQIGELAKHIVERIAQASKALR